MTLPIVLAEVLGIMLTVTGLSLLASSKRAVALINEVIGSPALLWIYGFMAMVLGIVILTFNNSWTSGNLQLLVTIIGWLALLKGMFILILPDAAIRLYRKCNKSGLIILAGFVALIVGLLLMYKGL